MWKRSSERRNPHSLPEVRYRGQSGPQFREPRLPICANFGSGAERIEAVSSHCSGGYSQNCPGLFQIGRIKPFVKISIYQS